jgi:hypothetical protein
MPSLFGFLKKRSAHKVVDQNVAELTELLKKGNTSSDYQETKRVVAEIKKHESQDLGDWERGYLAECLRGARREDTAAWLVYSLVNQEGFDNTEFISAIARRHRSQLWWWLEHYAGDTEQPDSLREFAKDYLLPSCGYCGALRVTSDICEKCGRPVKQN